MNGKLWAMSLALITMIALPTAAVRAQDSAELLIPVKSEVAAKLMDKRNYGLREQLYFARRHRLVQVNFSLLERLEASVSLTAFEDVSLQLSAVPQTSPAQYDHRRAWNGRLVKPQLAGFPEYVITLWINSGEQPVSPAAARRIMADQGVTDHMGPAPRDAATRTSARVSGTSARLNLTTLSGKWLDPIKGTYMVIQPVSDDPRYHVVYEEDRTKLPSGVHVDSAEARERVERREAFMRQLEAERAAEAATHQN